MRMPDNMALWDKWEALYTRLGDDDERTVSEQEALNFYQKHKKAMDAGAIVSWENVRPLYRLMCIRATDHDAFNQEYQNEAGNDDNAPFKNIQFWVNRLAEWIFFGAIDPSMGKKLQARDPSAILVGGLNPNTMILDVVEADIARRVPDLIISRAVDLQIEYRCLMWSVECVAFQEFMYTELIKRAALKSISFPAMPGPTGRNKEMAILSLQPHSNNGLIRLHHHQTTMIEQTKFYPEADHDDGPDCLEMLYKIATQFIGDYKYTSAVKSRGQARRGSNHEDYDEWDDDD
jgi:predicted phage terminase large subunit-like protein